MPNNTILPNYYEMIAPEQIGSAQFTPSGSEATLDFIVRNDYLNNFAKDVLGSCEINNAGYLNRNLPLSHPTFSYMYATQISSVVGYGQDGRMLSDNFPNKAIMGTTDYRAPKYQAVYDYYRISVKFETRPYLLLSDRQLQNLQGWGQDFQYAKRTKDNVEVALYKEYFEWMRFVSVDVQPANETIVANRGNYYFRCDNPQNNENAPVDYKPISNQNSGSVYLVQTKNLVTVTWFFVPYIMSRSLGIKEAVNKVNFGYDFGDGSYDVQKYGYKFLGYPAGSLLMSNVNVKPYEAATPLYPPNDVNPDVAVAYNQYNTYCDIEFKFLEVEIPNDQIGKYPARSDWANRLNAYGRIFYGHNSVPYSNNKKYYYIESNQDPDKGYPIYWSTSFSRMFTYIT